MIHYADIFFRATLKKGKFATWEEAQARCGTRKNVQADTRWSKVNCPKCLAQRKQR